ncbi:MAG: site-specific DNA-methyltransferase [Chloroflexi bacterium]|nr:site-specific DNA-methyltransferase [Chloroflexota bacterium]
MQLPLPHFTPEDANLVHPDILTLPDRVERLRRLLTRDLNFHGHTVPDPLHRLHPFPAKFPPQLPRLFIQHLTEPGQTILDPMMGSGTTLLEAQHLHRQALGNDIDPLALTLVAAKSQPPTAAQWARTWPTLIAQGQDWMRREQALRRIHQKRFDAETQRFLNYWFLPETQRALLALTLAIEQITELKLRRFARVIFSSLIIAKSGSVAQARDLSHTRPHRVERPPKPVFDLFAQKAQRAERMLRSRQEASHVTSRIIEADAQRMPWKSSSIDLVVTSPPYAANAIDYMRAHKFTLVWWGYSVHQLRNRRRGYIGGEAIQGQRGSRLPNKAEEVIEDIAAIDTKKASSLRRYFTEMRNVFQEIARVIRPGGFAIIVVGDSTMRGRSTRTPEVLAVLGEDAGLQHIGTGKRMLDRDRRMMPTRHGRITSSIERRMHVEYVLGFHRPLS